MPALCRRRDRRRFSSSERLRNTIKVCWHIDQSARSVQCSVTLGDNDSISNLAVHSKTSSTTMGFKFKRKESLGKGFRRLAIGQLRKALTQSRASDQKEGLHEVRKSIKRTRALLRLFRPCLKKADYRCCAKPLRDATKLLSPSRDAQVKINALDSLNTRLGKAPSQGEFAAFRQILARECDEQQRKLAVNKSVARVRRLLKSACGRFYATKLKQSGWAALAPGIKNCYCTAQRSFAQVKAHPTGKHFHECRKRGKDLYYQLGLLQRVHPGSLSRAGDKLERLGECLGNDHDLLLLSEFVLGRGDADSSGKIAVLRQLIARRQKDLRSEAIRIGSNCYHQKPLVFCNRLGDYWKAWRRGT
jgi:CHAD domain-containing protein